MQIGARVDGRFEIEFAAGAGGMGDVFRARDLKTDGLAAVKLLRTKSPELLARFDQEARTLARLEHPAIVRYLAHGLVDDGSPYIAMEWLEGEDLAMRLSRGPLNAQDAVTVARLAAEALGFAHAAGIVHRDVKPSNLFLQGGDPHAIKLLDFGIARALGDWHRSTRTGMGMGTPGYMAPEQASAARDVDARADVFSLGCVLFECLVGAPAFSGDNPLAVLAKILLSDPPRLATLRPDLSSELDTLLSSMLAKDRQARPNDGNAIARALNLLGPIERNSAELISFKPMTGLTHSEQRLVSVVAMAGNKQRDLEATLLPSEVENTKSLPSHTFDLSAPRLERLVDGSLLAIYTGQTSASDLVIQAARYALSLQALHPDRAIAVATGRGHFGGAGATGEAIDRVAALVSLAQGGELVRIDEATQGLLERRFDIEERSGARWLSNERPIEHGGRELVGKLTPCVGRERELATLGGLLDESIVEPRARAALVLGGAGVGKSRLGQELINKAKQRDHAIQIMVSRSDAVGTRSALGIVEQLIVDAAGLRDGGIDADDRSAALQSVVAAVVDPLEVHRVATFLGEVIAMKARDEDDEPLRAARKNPRLMADQVRFAWLEFIHATSLKAPLILVIDDMHWGDGASINLIDATLERCRDAPLLVLAFGRPETQEIHPGLWSKHELVEVLLGGISRRAGERLVKITLGDQTDARTLSRLLDAADGNPFYLEELIRAELRQSDAPSIPASLSATLQSRLEALRPEVRRVARAASIFGETFWRGGVCHLTVSDESETGELLSELAREEVIVARSSSRFRGEHEYAFRHALLRDAAAAMLTDEDRVIGNRMAGEWLESKGESDAALIASHFASGNDAKSASQWWLRAAELAIGRAALDEAIELAARAREGVENDAEGRALSGVALSIQADAKRSQGKVLEALTLIVASMALLDRASDAWCDAAAIRMHALGVQGDVASMRALGAELLSIESEGLARERWLKPAISAAYAAEVSFPESSRSEIFSAIERVMTAFPPSDPLIYGELALARGARAIMEQRFSDSLSSSRAAADALMRAGAHRRVGPALNQNANSFARIGQWEKAAKGFAAMLAHGEKMRLPVDAAVAKANLASVYLAQSEFVVAKRHASEALATFESQGLSRLSTFARIALAGSALAEGDNDRAVAIARDALERTQGEVLRAYVKARLAQALVAAKKPAEAIAVATSALEAIAQGTDLEDNMGSTLRLANAEALHDLGHLEAAREAVASARSLLLEQASKLERAEWRDSFLEAVPQHQRILARFAEWSPEASTAL